MELLLGCHFFVAEQRNVVVYGLNGGGGGCTPLVTVFCPPSTSENKLAFFEGKNVLEQRPVDKGKVVVLPPGRVFRNPTLSKIWTYLNVFL